MRESASEEDGGRFLADARGVYLHSDEFRHKAEWYAPYLAVLPHVFWKVLIEASVDRSRKRKPQRKTDQWIQPAESVELVAVWLRIKSANDMGPDDWYGIDGWNPDDERNPRGDPGGPAGGPDGVQVIARPTKRVPAPTSYRKVAPQAESPVRQRSSQAEWLRGATLHLQQLKLWLKVGLRVTRSRHVGPGPSG